MDRCAAREGGRLRRRSIIAACLAGLLLATAVPALGQESAVPRIVGGVEVDPPDKYPFMAAIVWRGSDSFNGQFCGGSVIAASWVMTAAHCVAGESAATLDVVVGRHDLGTNTGERIPVAQIVRHPDFDRNTNANDLALLRLASPTAYAPVLLPADGSLEAAGTTLTVIGWGTMEYDPPRYPYELREVSVPVVGDTVCRAAYTGYGIAPAELILCAGATGRDSCQGDSGGPLFAATAQGFTQVGVVSSGEGCGWTGFPGLYTSVAAFTAWITEKTGAVPPSPATGPSCGGVAATIVGTAAADTIEGTSGPDVIVGLAGNDTISGGGGNDRICGGEGNDTLNGGPGNDALFGDAGDDTLDAGEGSDTVSGGSGTDTCYGESRQACELPASSAPTCFGMEATIVGTAAADTIEGTGGPDVIVGLAGNDTINGRGGNDRICGGYGRDVINAGVGGDQVQGGGGNDVIQGSLGADVLRGGGGIDQVSGGSGNDSLFGEGSADTLDGGDGNDTVNGGAGIDTCYGEARLACELPAEAASHFESGALHLAIPNNSPGGVSSVIEVVAPGAISDLDVGVLITHTWVGDLSVTLTHVDTGTTVTLIDRPGAPGTGTVGCMGENIDATLDDEASSAVETECLAAIPTISGAVRPNNPLSAFDGEQLAGTWRLTVTDHVVLDEGFLEAWALDFAA